MEITNFEKTQLNFISEIKQKIRQAQYEAMRAVNVQLAQFYTEYHDVINLVPLVREISWSKHVTILKRCKDNLERQFYGKFSKFFKKFTIISKYIINFASTKHL